MGFIESLVGFRIAYDIGIESGCDQCINVGLFDECRLEENICVHAVPRRLCLLFVVVV